jgi:phosphopantetheine--protein transferase-like protein
VGYTELRDLTRAELAWLSDDERDREFGSNNRRRQFQCGRALLRQMLEVWTGTPAARHELTTEDGGKPICVGGPAISITHAGQRVACSVVSEGLVGIDLERIDEGREIGQITQRFFSDKEKGWIEAGPKSRFYMLWVLKEAFVKAHGQSIFGGLEKLRCVVEPPDISAQSTEGDFSDLSLYRRDDMFLALATTEAALDNVSFRCWVPGSAGFEDGDEYTLIATTNDDARKHAA